MKYVAHRNFSGNYFLPGSELQPVVIPEGTEMEIKRDWLLHDKKHVCMINSYLGHQYFARDDDGRGLERGALTYKIAFEPRQVEGTGYRFSDEERKIICEEYPHWLRQDAMTILFNNEFFAADVDELKKFAERLFGGTTKCTESKTATEI